LHKKIRELEIGKFGDLEVKDIKGSLAAKNEEIRILESRNAKLMENLKKAEDKLSQMIAGKELYVSDLKSERIS